MRDLWWDSVWFCFIIYSFIFHFFLLLSLLDFTLLYYLLPLQTNTHFLYKIFLHCVVINSCWCIVLPPWNAAVFPLFCLLIHSHLVRKRSEVNVVDQRQGKTELRSLWGIGEPPYDPRCNCFSDLWDIFLLSPWHRIQMCWTKLFTGQSVVALPTLGSDLMEKSCPINLQWIPQNHQSEEKQNHFQAKCLF